MKIIIGSSLCILGWAVILNSIGLSSQSETPRLPVNERYRDDGIDYPALSMKSGVPIKVLKEFGIPDLPVRKLRCPQTWEKTWLANFRIKKSDGFYDWCRQDYTLLAIGPVIFGYILEDWIRPLANQRCQEILYDERYDKQTVLDMDYLEKNFNIASRVPEYLENLKHHDSFGVWKPKTTGESPVFEHGNSSTSGSQTPRRSTKKFFSKIFSCSSSHSSKPPSGGGTSSR